MKKILVLSLLVISMMFTGKALAAGDTATFSATADKSTYAVGDTVKVSLSVDAGTYASSLSVIDFKVRISDPTVVEPATSTPLTLGSIYSNSVTQSYSNGVVSAVVFVDPNNKPANRSGVIGTLNLKAVKVGKAVISYDNIQATEQNNELSYITTTASSLTINVEAGVAAQGTQTAVTTTGSSSSGAGTSATRTATPQPGKATTGPAEVIAVAIGSGILILLGIKLFRKLNASAGKI
jgi:hypothetical protein